MLVLVKRRMPGALNNLLFTSCMGMHFPSAVGFCVCLFACISVLHTCLCRCSLLAHLKLLEIYRSR